MAVEDAGIMPGELRRDQWVLDLSGPADPYYGRAVPPGVASRLVAVVVGAGQADSGEPWWGDSSSGAIFGQAGSRKFQVAGSVLYAPGYFLRVYVRPDLENQVSRQLRNIGATAARAEHANQRRAVDAPHVRHAVPAFLESVSRLRPPPPRGARSRVMSGYDEVVYKKAGTLPNRAHLRRRCDNPH